MYEEIKTAVIYARYSSSNQTEQSIEGQLRVCKEFCQRQGILITNSYIDRATSASKNVEKRVEFLRMIKDSDKHNFDAVIVYKLDRFSRSRYDMATYKYRLKKNGVTLISATENISQDPEGIILESVLEGMAEFYSAELSQKILRGMKESSYKHYHLGGRAPLGYKIENRKLVIDPVTAPLVRNAFEMYAEGTSIADICRDFNAKGYTTSNGGAFGKSSFTKMFKNEKYIGVYEYKDYRAENVIPAIIDKELFNRVQKMIGDVKQAPARHKAKTTYLLSGKCFCGICGSNMNGDTNQYGSKYRCYGKKNLNKNCNKKDVNKDHIEHLVAEDALSMLTNERIELIASIAVRESNYEMENGSMIPTIRDRLHETRLSLRNITKAIESGDIPQTLLKRMIELEKEEQILENELKREEQNYHTLDKAEIIYWLEQFKGGNINDEDFRKTLIDLFVNSVTLYDNEDGSQTVTISYNLAENNKTYRLNNDGRSPLSDLHTDLHVSKSNPTLLFHSTIMTNYQWVLISPSGERFQIEVLREWLKTNLWRFGKENNKTNLVMVAKNLEHVKYKSKYNLKPYTYKGWSILLHDEG